MKAKELYESLFEGVVSVMDPTCDGLIAGDGDVEVKYGFNGLCASAGSDDYYDKKSYIIIALAPIVVWGIILAIVNFIVPTEWFWIVYIIQIINISGAAGDMYVTVKFSGFPKDILIKDCGVGMTVYSKQALDR